MAKALATKPAYERGINQGGLMRCCIETLRTSDEDTEPGDRIECRHCKGSMVVAPNGLWVWDRP